MQVCCKAFKTLGFIFRLANEFRCCNISVKFLYCAFVKPILECTAVVWNPSTAAHSKQLERVRLGFFRFVKNKFSIPCVPHIYIHVSTLLDLSGYLLQLITGDFEATCFSMGCWKLRLIVLRFNRYFHLMYHNEPLVLHSNCHY